MFLRDMFCTGCGFIVRDMDVGSGSVTTINRVCDNCGEETIHQDLAHGGSKLRCFVTDFHSRNWSSEEAQFLRAGVETDGEPVVDLDTGEAIEDRPQFQPDAVNQQRDEVNAAFDRRKGRTPIVMDMGS